MTQNAERNRFVDQPDSFGWLSIALHWVTAAIIVALWIIGRSIVIQDSTEAIDARRSVHIMIALSAWLLLLLRIVWRLRMHHPHAAGQSLFIHRAAQSVHYIMLVVLSLMMISGPCHGLGRATKPLQVSPIESTPLPLICCFVLVRIAASSLAP